MHKFWGDYLSITRRLEMEARHAPFIGRITNVYNAALQHVLSVYGMASNEQASYIVIASTIFDQANRQSIIVSASEQEIPYIGGAV